MNPPGGELDEEQDIERLQEHRLDGEEVARQHSPALCSEELAPGRTRPARRGTEASATKDATHGAGPDPDSELAQFALDPHAPPSGVLSSETNDEISRLGVEGRPAGTSTRVGPLPPDQLAVPAKECLRCHHERGPPVPGERPARSGEEPPVDLVELRTSDGAPEHHHLVAEDGVLQLELRHVSPAGEHSDKANEHEVDEGSQGARMLPASVNHREPSFGARHPSAHNCMARWPT